MYIYKNKRHAWVKTATSRAELSYVSVQVLSYNPSWPVATASDSLSPDEWTFARIEATHIVYVFLPSQGSTFSDLGGGCHSIPTVLRQFLQSLNIPTFIRDFEKQLKSLKSVRAEQDN